jgi:cytochrome P450
MVSAYGYIVSFAAIHTTTTTSCQAIFDLVVRPEYIQPLRDEIEQVIAEDGHEADSDGFLKLKKASLTKLKKLDSFLKESQRFNPTGLGKPSSSSSIIAV